MAEDASSEKFLVTNFTNYKMTDSRLVLEQYNELLGILGRFTQHKMNMDEAIQDDDVVWWVDSVATVHVCKDRCWFKTYEPLNDGSILHMGNESTALVHGRGCVDPSFSSGKIVSLFNVLLVPNIRKKLVSSSVLNNCGYIRDVIFDENIFSLVPRPNLRIPNGTEYIGGSVVLKVVTEEKEVINDVMDSIIGNNTWVLADLPPGCKPLGCKWIFKRKLKVDGTVKNTIRLLIAMISIHNPIIHQMDVKTAFLNGELEEGEPKQWHQKFDEVVLSNGYLLSQADKCVDMTKEFLLSRFSMKDMGEANKFNYFDCTPMSAPMDTSEKLMPNNDQAVSQLEYSRVIGCLMYAMNCTRPDIAFDVGKLSMYTSNPVLEGYTDVSWISNTEDNSSTSGWVFLLGGGAISWSSKKQTCITGLTIESEFVALAAAGKEAEWLKNLLFEIPLWFKPIAPIFIRCDSAATLVKAYSQMYNGKSRHLGVRHSMIRELITNEVVSIEFVRSQQNLADHLTKGLARDLVIKFAEGMGLKFN
ncbi:hypothetical protein Tco_0798400 [Tanacetum coccineum]